MGLPCAILDEDQVLIIKRLIYKGEKLEDIADKYEMSFRTISNIKRGVNWPNVKWPTGTTGAIPKKRALEITKERLKMRRSPEYQARVLATRTRNQKAREKEQRAAAQKKGSKKPNGN